VLKRLLEDDPTPPRRKNAEIPRDLETICLKCLEKEPSRRYVSAGALADDLGRFSRGEAIHARPVSGVERLERWCRRRPAVVGLSFALFVVATGSIAVYLGQHEHARASDARALINERAKEKLLGETVLELENKLRKATDRRHSLSFVPEYSRNDLLEDIEGLARRLD